MYFYQAFSRVSENSKKLAVSDPSELNEAIVYQLSGPVVGCAFGSLLTLNISTGVCVMKLSRSRLPIEIPILLPTQSPTLSKKLV
mmetsp:Transcript_14065/g.32747  ORF Transcript_14065/g.32747 Transcript_14065/m.32747 type:complete len:85 (+) Transcript_14065:4457-4711(+)